MRATAAPKYLLNCFLLVVPALILNLLWSTRLPPMWQSESFSKGIPLVIAYGESISRVVIMVLPMLMPLRLSTKRQRTGLAIYIIVADRNRANRRFALCPDTLSLVGIHLAVRGLCRLPYAARGDSVSADTLVRRLH